MSRSSYKKSRYDPINKSKYIGKHIPVCRSSWEMIICQKFDMNPQILEWASEPFGIQYSCLNIDGAPKWEIYVPDFYIKVNDEKFIVEVKPYKQTIPPTPPKINNKKALEKYRAEQVLYLKNKAKWKYTENFCKKNGFKFTILTEKDVPEFIKRKKK